MNFDTVLLVTTALLGLSVLASKASAKLGVPVLVLFVAIGMLAGSDGPGGIWFDDARMAQQIGTVALIFILFSGGMDTDMRIVRRHWGHGLSLSIVGVAVTAGLVGLAAHLMLGFTLLEGFLLGAIISSTDAAAVFTTLRGGGASLRQDLQAMLELESGTNDPLAIFLTATLVGLISSTLQPGGGLAVSFVVQMVVGIAAGLAIGRGGVWVMRKLRLDVDGLYHVASIVVMLGAYALTAKAGGNGFLAVYVAGLVYGNAEFRQRKGLRRFHDGMAWLMQIAMFLVLGLLVFPKQLPAVFATGVVVALVLMMVARPVGVVVALLPFRIGWREQALVAWTGLRGAVPIILATFPLLAGLERAQEIFNLVFFVVLLSALVQGPTLPWFAKALGLLQPHSDPGPTETSATAGAG